MYKRRWHDYLWIASSIYILLGFVNILFAWLGLLCFFIPLIIAITRGTKSYCNNYCGRGQLLGVVGSKLSLGKKLPAFFYSKWLRYGFLTFFLTMFGIMVFNTYLVFSGTNSLREAITLFWTFKVPWQWTYTEGVVSPWIAQFAFGFYSLMLTSTLIGLIFMASFRPRSWCIICPMGTMTQLICKLKSGYKNG